MTGCSICRFLDQPFNFAKRQIFEGEINRGTSLRALVVLMRGWGFETSKDTLSRHIRICMKRELKESKITTLKEFFNPPTIIKESECQHKEEFRRFNEETLMVDAFCKSCGKFLYSFDPEEDHSKRNDQRLWYRIAEEKRQAKKYGQDIWVGY